MLRVGIVGLNERIRRQVLPALAASPNGQPVAVCSRDLDKAATFAGPYEGCRPFGSLAEMLDSDDVDAVFVMTPPELHHEMSIAAIERGRAVLCEKPLATCLRDAEAMADAASARGVRTAVNFTYRSVTALRLLERAIADPGIGDLLHVEVAYFQGRGLLRQQRPSHVLLELGSHAVDALLWWCDVRGNRRPVAAASLPGATERSFGALVDLTGGAFAVVQASKVALGFDNAIVTRLHGSEGALHLRFDVGAFELERYAAVEPPVARRIETPPELHLTYEEFPRFHWDRICRALLGLEEFPDFRQGARVQAVMEAAIAAGASGRVEPIRLP